MQRNISIRSTDDPAKAAAYKTAFRSMLTSSPLSVTDRRSLSAGNDSLGGFLLTPPEWSGQLISAIRDVVRVRQLASYFPVTSGVSFRAPSVEVDTTDPAWTDETGTIIDDAEFQAGQRELSPHLLARGVKISDKLLRATAGFAENVVIYSLSYKLGVAEEKHFMTGHGAGQPLGVFTPSAQGVPTSRDIPVDLAQITMGGMFQALRAAKYSLKAQYWNKSEWFIHRDVLKIIANITDGNGRPIYHEPEDADKSPMLLGRPVNVSESAPNTIAVGGYLAVLGDFTHYAISDIVDTDIKILSELYAAQSITGIICKRWVDGMPTLGEAFARVIIQ